MPHSLAAGGAIQQRGDFSMGRSEAQKIADRKYDEKRAGKRGENWGLVIYPDSMPANWRDLLSELCIQVLVSPLHDSDVNATGEPKKPHHHVLLIFDSVKSQSQVSEIAKMLNAPAPMKMDSARGAARYLCHMDNPEKAQYSPDEVLEFGGADYRSICMRTPDKYGFVREMVTWCREQGVISYAALLEYAMTENEDWFRCLCDNGTYVMKEYLKSAGWEGKN